MEVIEGSCVSQSGCFNEVWTVIAPVDDRFQRLYKEDRHIYERLIPSSKANDVGIAVMLWKGNRVEHSWNSLTDGNWRIGIEDPQDYAKMSLAEIALRVLKTEKKSRCSLKGITHISLQTVLTDESKNLLQELKLESSQPERRFERYSESDTPIHRRFASRWELDVIAAGTAGYFLYRLAEVAASPDKMNGGSFGWTVVALLATAGASVVRGKTGEVIHRAASKFL